MGKLMHFKFFSQLGTQYLPKKAHKGTKQRMSGSVQPGLGFTIPY